MAGTDDLCNPIRVTDLLDDLVLHIVSKLQHIRSFVIQSQAFENKKEEISRQCENDQRHNTVYSLCFTSAG
jgi:hypothetical protein